MPSKTPEPKWSACERTWTLASPQGTSAPFIQIFSISSMGIGPPCQLVSRPPERPGWRLSSRRCRASSRRARRCRRCARPARGPSRRPSRRRAPPRARRSSGRASWRRSGWSRTGWPAPCRRYRGPSRGSVRRGSRRRQGAGQPVRDHPERRHDARPELRRARGGARRREGRRDGPRAGRAHRRHRRARREEARHRRHDRRHPGRSGGRLTRKRGGPMPITEVDKIWMNGELVPWGEAKVHVLTHALHYGSGVFEGIRCYDTVRGSAVFRLREHLRRLERSARLYHMPVPYILEKLVLATHQVIRANGLKACYIRPLVFRGYGEMGIFPMNAPVDAIIAVWPWGAYLGEEGVTHGIRAK